MSKYQTIQRLSEKHHRRIVKFLNKKGESNAQIDESPIIFRKGSLQDLNLIESYSKYIDSRINLVNNLIISVKKGLLQMNEVTEYIDLDEFMAENSVEEARERMEKAKSMLDKILPQVEKLEDQFSDVRDNLKEARKVQVTLRDQIENARNETPGVYDAQRVAKATVNIATENMKIARTLEKDTGEIYEHLTEEDYEDFPSVEDTKSNLLAANKILAGLQPAVDAVEAGLEDVKKDLKSATEHVTTLEEEIEKARGTNPSLYKALRLARANVTRAEGELRMAKLLNEDESTEEPEE